MCKLVPFIRVAAPKWEKFFLLVITEIRSAEGALSFPIDWMLW
jgi:hypothetical protein